MKTFSFFTQAAQRVDKKWQKSLIFSSSYIQLNQLKYHIYERFSFIFYIKQFMIEYLHFKGQFIFFPGSHDQRWPVSNVLVVHYEFQYLRTGSNSITFRRGRREEKKILGSSHMDASRKQVAQQYCSPQKLYYGFLFLIMYF